MRLLDIEYFSMWYAVCSVGDNNVFILIQLIIKSLLVPYFFQALPTQPIVMKLFTYVL